MVERCKTLPAQLASMSAISITYTTLALEEKGATLPGIKFIQNQRISIRSVPTSSVVGLAVFSSSPREDGASKRMADLGTRLSSQQVAPQVL